MTVPPAPGPFDPSGSGCSPAPGALPDGIWYGFPADSTESTLEFDLACWFAGEAAVKAASEDGQESPPPNDYHIRNENHTNRTLMVAEDTPVIWYPNSAPTSETSTTWSKWRLATGSREIPPGIWVKIEHGSVVSIQEQWVP